MCWLVYVGFGIFGIDSLSTKIQNTYLIISLSRERCESLQQEENMNSNNQIYPSKVVCTNSYIEFFLWLFDGWILKIKKESDLCACGNVPAREASKQTQQTRTNKRSRSRVGERTSEEIADSEQSQVLSNQTRGPERITPCTLSNKRQRSKPNL